MDFKDPFKDHLKEIFLAVKNLWFWSNAFVRWWYSTDIADVLAAHRIDVEKVRRRYPAALRYDVSSFSSSLETFKTAHNIQIKYRVAISPPVEFCMAT